MHVLQLNWLFLLIEICVYPLKSLQSILKPHLLLPSVKYFLEKATENYKNSACQHCTKERDYQRNWQILSFFGPPSIFWYLFGLWGSRWRRPGKYNCLFWKLRSIDCGINTVPQPRVVKRRTMKSKDDITLSNPAWGVLTPQFLRLHFLQREKRLTGNDITRKLGGKKF